MTCLLDGFDDRLAVIIYMPQLDAVALRVGLQKHISRLQAWRDWVSHTAQIDGTNAAYLPIERHMGMPNDHQVGLAASQSLLQFVIAVLGMETRSIISAWSRMDAEYAGAIR